tara:strand:+ start:539 stop:880 length:342 start_codon:yes stop_codon:yes gene_type:complete
MNKEFGICRKYNRDVEIKQLHKRNNIKTLNKYSKIVDKIGTIGDTGGTHHDTHYYNYQGALEDFYLLEDSIKDGLYEVSKAIMCRLDKALIVSKTISKIDKLEDILDENIQYG